MSGNLTISDDNDHHYSDDIESLILQSVEQQLKKEETLRQNIITNLPVNNEISETILSPTTSTTAAAVTETSIITPSIPVPPTTSIKMIMNRHRRSRYEQESLQSVVKNNTSITGKVCPMNIYNIK